MAKKRKINIPFPTKLLLILFGVCIVLHSLANLWEAVDIATLVLGIVVVALLLYNFAVLYLGKGNFDAIRVVPSRMSNGDDNEILLYIENKYGRSVKAEIEDEVPDFLQVRNFCIKTDFKPYEKKKISYSLRPVRRGTYVFNDINIFVSVFPYLIQRRIVISQVAESKVYPAFAFLHNMEFLSIRNRDFILGAHKIRKIGQSKEFENIREYAVGDDYRLMNWKASARRHQLMVNQYSEERCQNIYSIIDKGRGMQHTFNGMTLLDYSINSTLQLSFVSLQKGDNAGLLTFERKVFTHIPASRTMFQLHKFQESLLNETSDFAQSDYSKLYEYCSTAIHKRSLFVLYTSFDSITSLRRQLPYIQQLAKTHVVLVVFFIDSDIQKLAYGECNDVEEHVTQMVAQKFVFEQKQIVSELKKRGIYSLLTHPNSLNVNVINKYLEFKARNII